MAEQHTNQAIKNTSIMHKEPGTWKRGLLYLLLLGPFFFGSYGFANWYAGSLDAVSSLKFGWEQYIPLWPWTIVPYWSIDLFYGLSLLLCWNRRELNTHALRLLTAQFLCIACFLLFPLKFSVERPALEGVFGHLFDLLMGFDKPFNQAPSLHIVLLLILWNFYYRHLSGIWRVVLHVWAFLIGVSVLTTWQHHFIDIPTGMLAAGICLWLWPLDRKSPLAGIKWRNDPKRLRLAAYYLLACIGLTGLGFWLQSYALWLLWPATSLLMVALAYSMFDTAAFQKKADGSMSLGSYLLFSPYFAFAWLNTRAWTYKKPQPSLIFDINIPTATIQLYLGRLPSKKQLQQFEGLLDCCAELPVCLPSANYAYGLVPILDLTTPTLAQLKLGVEQLDAILAKVTLANAALLNATIVSHQDRQVDQPPNSPTILVSCALGYSRSACVLAAWLIWHRHATSTQQAVEIIQHGRPFVVLKERHIAELDKLLSLKQRSPHTL